MRVYLLAKPAVDWDQASAWIKSLDGQAWLDRIEYERAEDSTGQADAEGAELVSEMGGRRCYQSWRPGLNPNVTKVREDSTEYLQNIVKVGHGSVLEHGMFTFAIEGVSRVVTHELVRHRAGTAVSQESLRYVRLTDIPFNMPDFILDDPILEEEATDLLLKMEAFQELIAERTDIDNLDSFHEKKQITSAARRFAPIGVATGLVWSANVRALRQIVEARTDPGAEEEIRRLFHIIGEFMKDECPSLFADFTLRDVDGSDVPAWIPDRSKV